MTTSTPPLKDELEAKDLRYQEMVGKLEKAKKALTNLYNVHSHRVDDNFRCGFLDGRVCSCKPQGEVAKAHGEAVEALTLLSEIMKDGQNKNG